MSIIGGTYHGMPIQIVDADENIPVKRVIIEPLDGSRPWRFEHWKGGIGYEIVDACQLWVPISEVHNVHLSSVQSDITVAQPAEV